MKTLIFPGSFNPTHFGHLKLLQHAIEEAKPDKTIILPCYKSSAAKEAQYDTPTRIEIARAAVDNTLPLPLSEMVGIGGYSFESGDPALTHHIVEFYRKANEEGELWVLLGRTGAKVAAHKWEKPSRIAEAITGLLVAKDADDSDLNLLRKRYPVKLLPFKKASPVTSAKAREMLAAGKTPWRYVPRATLHIFEQRELYGVKGPECPA